MWKILTAEQTRKADAYTIDHEPISSEALMERAATRCSEWLRRNLPYGLPVVIVCGTGNNGGDGLVIARHLARDGYDVTVIIPFPPDSPKSTDNQINIARLQAQQLVHLFFLISLSDLPAISPGSIVIDALFGSGLSRRMEGLAAQVIDHLNQIQVTRIAVDIPSGMRSDSLPDSLQDTIFKADYTLTFLPPKRTLMAPELEKYYGEVHFFDIGLHPAFFQSVENNTAMLTSGDLVQCRKTRSRHGHKGTYGHALIVAGSAGKEGAALLASSAALASGAGLVTAHVPSEAVTQLNTFCPEVMSHPFTDGHQTDLPNIEMFDTAGIGPGLGTDDQAVATLKKLINYCNYPLVFDADALNILSKNPTWLAFLPKNSILTPHPGEFERLAGKSRDSLERVDKQRELSLRHRLIVVLKGAYTSIATPDGAIFFNNTGNAGMATAGSGDVLTGLITGLIAQGYRPLEAALCGVWLHGRSGDLALAEHTMQTLNARHLIQFLPKAFSESLL